MSAVQRMLSTIAVSALLTVEGQPSCKFHGDSQSDLVCTSGPKPYTLQRGLISDNDSITTITLRGCNIVAINSESFSGFSHLRYLDLSKNKIPIIQTGALDGYNLIHLNLSFNAITDLPLGVFDSVPNIEVLDLKSNRLNLLKRGVLDSLTKLKHLDLSSNSILGRDLSRFELDKNKMIEFMDFSRSDMSSTPSNLLQAFENIKVLNLDESTLKGVPKFATQANLNTMEHLILSKNKITEITDPKTFERLENLEILDLAENKLVTIYKDVLKPLKKLKMVVLRNNNLVNIPDTLFTDMVKLNSIDLSHNLIEFVPVNAFRGSRVRNLNLADNKFTYLTDNFLLELQNSGTIVLKFYFNQNPWQCACLKDVLKEVNTLGVQYNSVKYNGKQPVCVTVPGEFYCKRNQNFNELFVSMYFTKIISSTLL